MPALGSRPSSLGPSLEMQDESCTTWMRCSIPYSAISMACFTILSFHIHARAGHPPISFRWVVPALNNAHGIAQDNKRLKIAMDVRGVEAGAIDFRLGTRMAAC